MLTKEELPECPVATTVQLIGSILNAMQEWGTNYKNGTM